MGAEIFDVEVILTDGNTSNTMTYATKVGSKRNSDASTTLTFQGDVNVRAKNTGGTITVEGLSWPSTIDEVKNLEEMLSNETPITTITCTGKAYTYNGDAYTRKITGNNVIVTSDEDEWSPSDGITKKLEFSVNTLTREAYS